MSSQNRLIWTENAFEIVFELNNDSNFQVFKFLSKWPFFLI